MPGRRLSVEERLVIQLGVDAGHTQQQIAEVLDHDPSTISREVRRNGGKLSGRRVAPGNNPRGRPRRYQARRAQRLATSRARRPKPCKIVGALAAVVTGLLEADQSPQQIAAMLPVLYPGDEVMSVSHETIYQSLFVQTRGELRRELTAHLRSQQRMRRSRATRARNGNRGRITGMVSIRQRPPEAQDRALPGH